MKKVKNNEYDKSCCICEKYLKHTMYSIYIYVYISVGVCMYLVKVYRAARDVALLRCN